MPQSNFESVAVAVESDFVQQQARTSPIQALAECIWNGLDADAKRVEVELDQGTLGLQRIVIRDYGTGMTREKAPELFRKLGGSWKKFRGRTASGRELHGSEGRGRYKVTVLGRVADWHVTYDAGGGELRRFTITVMRDDLKEVRFTQEETVESGQPGVELVITEPLADFRSLRSDEAPQDLAEIFATYLRNYTDVTISLQGIKLDPSTIMSGPSAEMNLGDIVEDDRCFPVRLEIVEWNRKTKRVMYLCDDRGFPMSTVDTKWHVGERFFSAYFRSSYIRLLSDRNELAMGEMNSRLVAAIEEARQKIKEHFRSKVARESKAVVDSWKIENVYPFPDAPSNPIEEATQDVFNIIATAAVRFMPEFPSYNSTSRAFQLRMMRTAIENGSDDLQLIMKEVLRLPVRQQEELAKLIQEASLPAIITAGKVVSDRMKFLTALEALIFDKEMGKTLRERTQLHRLLVDHTWVFGEEHHLMVDDRTLDECLKQHTGAKNITVAKGAVKHPTKARGIVDLMFGKQKSGYKSGSLEHLVVELKAPRVSIGHKEIGQIDGYVEAITGDSRFDTSTTKWIFWVLSRKVDPGVMRVRQLQHAPLGTIVEQDNLVIMVKTWASVIEENRARMKFFQESLQLEITKSEALRHLKAGYEDIFKDTPVEPAMDDVINGLIDDQEGDALDEGEVEDVADD